MHDIAIRDVGRAKSEFRNTNPEVVAWGDGVDERSKRNLKADKESVEAERKKTREKNRKEALEKHEASAIIRAWLNQLPIVGEEAAAAEEGAVGAV